MENVPSTANVLAMRLDNFVARPHNKDVLVLMREDKRKIVGQGRLVVFGMVLERDPNFGAIGGDLAPFQLHVKLHNFGNA
jgi:hypothetical protein